MAIVQEYFNVNGRDFIKTYSDAGRYVVRDGIEYSEACDLADFGRTYTEGNVMENNIIAEEILNILTGEEEEEEE